MPTQASPAAPARAASPVLLLSTNELRERYAEAAAQARLFAGLLRLVERVGRRGAGPVLVPVRVTRAGARR